MRYPEPSFTHLMRLSDDTGLLEHAQGASPRREYGYCVDDVARGLVVICREPEPSSDLIRLAERYLAFVLHAQTPDGMFHNRLGYDRQWQDQPGTGDWWGRAMWGLGTVVADGPGDWMRHDALAGFERGSGCRPRWARAMAFAALGAAEVLSVRPEHVGARRLLADAETAVGRPASDRNWPWPQPRLEYANAVLAETLMAAGEHLGHDTATADGLDLLGWLLDVETRDGHLSTTPVGGWRAPEPRPAFDQQPIEAAALADACARALAVSGEPRWEAGLRRAVGWFLGANDTNVEMLDRSTGGGYDGLGRVGPNTNQGAESTLALLSALQHGRHLGSRRWHRPVDLPATSVASG
jgi:hypothetical protein